MSEDKTEKTPEEELFGHISELAEQMQERELASSESLGTRAATLIGFAGVVLTLTTALAREAFGRGSDLGTLGNPLSAVLFLLAVGALLVAAILAVRAAAPRERDVVTEKPLQTYSEKKPPVSTMLEHFSGKVTGVLKKLRKSNTKRGKTLQWSFRWLAIGLVLVAGQAAIMGIDRLTEVL